MPQRVKPGSFLFQSLGVFHLALHNPAQLLGAEFPHVVLSGLLRQVVGNGFDVYVYVAVLVRLGIQNATVGVILNNDIEEVEE